MPWTNEQRRLARTANPGKYKNTSGPSGKKPPSLRPFIAIDGEAIGESGYHLLAASTGDSIEDRSERGLSSEACLQFLIDLKAKHGKAIYCGFALGYDCEHWIRDFGEDVWRSLRKSDSADVQVNGKWYTIDYIPNKWFKMRLAGTCHYAILIQVFDVFSFFQAGFVSVVASPDHTARLEEEFPTVPGMPDWKRRLDSGWGAATLEEVLTLVHWKNRRGGFLPEEWDEVCAYNQIECQVLIRLMEALRAALLEVGININSWHGPGAVANFLLKRYNMGEHIASPPIEVQDAIARAYFGGRFQVFQLGHIEHVYDYDISSAYPFATTLLPSTQGRWERVGAYQGDENPWCVYLVSWDVKSNAGELSPFPWRDENGCIHYPSYGRGWYWGYEVASARRGWRNSIRVEDGWRLHTTEEGVFGWMKELAAKRVEAKQNAKQTCGTERERWQGIARAYKLALNSVYGKCIQTVGKTRPFLCPMWAGLITSHTRAKLLTAALENPRGLVCFATDGLFTTVSNAIEIGSQLGDWELAATDIRLELYQSGCYAIFKDGVMTDSRFRGISRADVPWDAMRKEWKKHCWGGTLKIQSKRFVGHRTALQRNKPELQATWQKIEKDVSLLPGLGLPFGNGKSVPWLAMLPNRDYTEISHRYRKLPPGETEAELDEEGVQP